MEETEAMEIFDETEAILTGHFVYVQGGHGPKYANKDAVYPHTKKIRRLCLAIAEKFKDDGIEAVIGPAIGGVIISQWVADYLTDLTGREVLAVFANKNKDETGFVIKRGYDKLIKGKKVLVVEDVTTTGKSVKMVVELTALTGGIVVGVGVLFNRGGVTSKDIANPPKFVALLNVRFETYPEENCPLCKYGVPINTDVGKGAEFLAGKGKM